MPIEKPDPAPAGAEADRPANLGDEAQSWRLDPDGTYTRERPRKKAFSAHDYFMSHPSLSGRGAVLGKRRARRRAARA